MNSLRWCGWTRKAADANMKNDAAAKATASGGNPEQWPGG